MKSISRTIQQNTFGIGKRDGTPLKLIGSVICRASTIYIASFNHDIIIEKAQICMSNKKFSIKKKSELKPENTNANANVNL